MRLLIIGFLCILYSCATTKKAINDAEIERFKNIVSNENIELEFEWAKPTALLTNVQGIQNLLPNGSSVGNINLIGNPNYFRIYNDSLAIELPYFGQQQLPNGYGNRENGITFTGKPEKKEIFYNNDKQQYTLKFWARSKEDSYVFVVELFPSNVSYLYVNSTNRTNINYDGSWQIITKEEK
ncbi:DUF4251 domain-containing protein [uncultured Polaribacter sp.]|uniref:DUF4251 domain-containing protein n=1 Tax=uncultured Polaribacter sp. TaxID=174711 RepID=UPI00263106E3|nr:DUF4251 domain-containing protein [uncultured Polaribacter sp.]